MITSRLATAVLLSVLFLPCLLFAQPKLDVVGGTKLDFGDIYTGKSHIQSVILRNVGSDTLKITNVSATCGCTGTLMSSDHIAPGDSGALSISFNPSRFGGPIEKAVSFDVNDSSQSHVRIVFKANVLKALEVRPDYVVFKVTPDSTGNESVTLKNLSQRTVHVVSVTSSSDVLRVTNSRNTLEPGEETAIDLTFTPKNSGAVKGTIVIQTDEPHMSTIDVRYFALVIGKSQRAASPTDQK